MHIVVLPGDGIGPEITTATSGRLRAASERFQLNLGLEEHAVGHASLKQFGTTVRPELARCEDAAPPIEVAKAIGEGRATRDVGGNARHDRRGRRLRRSCRLGDAAAECFSWRQTKSRKTTPCTVAIALNRQGIFRARCDDVGSCDRVDPSGKTLAGCHRGGELGQYGCL
jgi:hypothetical protein